MSYCSYCNYFAPTNARLQRHLNTNKHARNFMLVDAGIQELIPSDEPPTNDDDIPDLVQSNDDDIPDLVRTNDDDNSETVYNDDLPELDSLQIFDGLPDDDDDINELDSAQIVDLPNNVSTSTDNPPELIDVSLDTFDLELIPIDESTRDLAKMSFEITSSISQFFDDHPFAFHLFSVTMSSICFFGLIFFKSNQDKNTSLDSK
jgi:hypothetical protein